MSFLEWWGESVDPGSRGTVELGGAHAPCQSRTLILLRFWFVVLLLPVAWGVAVCSIPWPPLEAAAVVVGGTFIYVALAYLIQPEPSWDNMGVCGGLIDHPGRWSDDWNRFLVQLAIVLGPGRFIAESLLDARVLFAAAEEAPPTVDDLSDPAQRTE